MEMKEAIIAAIKELIFPKIQDLKNGQSEIKATLVLTNKRLDRLYEVQYAPELLP